MLKLIATTVLVLSACAVGGTDELPDANGNELDPAGGATVPDTYEGTWNPDEPSVCDLLPDGDDACAHACEPGGLASYIPEGTCTTFVCTLTDGSTYTTGGCN
jgi:hypothetical protein